MAASVTASPVPRYADGSARGLLHASNWDNAPDAEVFLHSVQQRLRGADFGLTDDAAWRSPLDSPYMMTKHLVSIKQASAQAKQDRHP
ncbi:hypothetical protein [Roseitranquillus sediminis]|uniref:hypothetical protein n=1 Tax=Roseitranquillus sediminis TaxID=2809051 RepID=UPI001D0C388A|nr:hypothetical protein [Roseitranquillus sediminis]MBM9593550.1 hypothetical protein [Roseitranquillus sediminis]